MGLKRRVTAYEPRPALFSNVKARDFASSVLKTRAEELGLVHCIGSDSAPMKTEGAPSPVGTVATVVLSMVTNSNSPFLLFPL